MEGGGNGKGVSSTAFQSRLSPLAQPFSSNRFAATATEATGAGASVLESFYDFHLEDLLDFSDDSYFAEYPSANAGSDSGFTPLVSASEFSSNKNASSAYKVMFEQGNPAVKGMQPYGYNSSESVHEKFSDLTRGRENLVISIPTGRNNIPVQNSLSAVVLESSDTSSTISPLYPVSSKNVNLNGNSAMKNYDSSLKCSPSDIKDLHHLMSAEGKEIHHDVNLKGNSALKNYDSSKCSPSGIKDLHHLMSAESKEIHYDESPNDQGKEGKDGKTFSREGLARLVTAKSEEAASLSKKWDEDDLDVDSPCWKGTLASRQSSFARSLSSDFVDNEQEGRNRLNPLAPHYFPRPSNSSVSYHAVDCSGDVLSTFPKSESSAVNSFSKGLIPVDQAVSKSSLLINGIGTKSSSDIHELERDYARINNAAEGLSDLLSSKTDVPTVLSAMHDLSQWLLQNCSDDLESFSEHENDLIQDIFNNLSMCIQHRAGGKTPISEKNLTGTPFYPNKSTEVHTCSSKGFQRTRTKPSAVLHELDYQNGYEGPKGNSHVFAKRILDSVPSWSGVSTEKSNSIIQVMGNNLRDNNLTKEELDPEAVVYKKLWLDAEAALRSLKYETYILCMKLEMGGYQVDENKAPGKLLTTQIHQL